MESGGEISFWAKNALSISHGAPELPSASKDVGSQKVTDTDSFYNRHFKWLADW